MLLWEMTQFCHTWGLLLKWPLMGFLKWSNHCSYDHCQQTWWLQRLAAYSASTRLCFSPHAAWLDVAEILLNRLMAQNLKTALFLRCKWSQICQNLWRWQLVDAWKIACNMSTASKTATSSEKPRRKPLTSDAKSPLRQEEKLAEAQWLRADRRELWKKLNKRHIGQ